jgi:hypothetical protein
MTDRQADVPRRVGCKRDCKEGDYPGMLHRASARYSKGLGPGLARNGCALNSFEIAHYKAMPIEQRSQRPNWESVTDCDGRSTRDALDTIAATRKLAGEDEADWHRLPEEHELKRETRERADRVDCPYSAATRAHSESWKGEKDDAEGST